MKKLLFFLSIPLLSLSQQITEDTIFHDGINRSYILYVPDSYSADQPASLVLNLHGYGMNAGEQMIYSNFYPIADDKGFILVHPQGTQDVVGSQFWNSGSGGQESNIDDVGFLSNLIDTLSDQYNIDTDRVYSTGMSNGGFMSYRLACDLSHKIAAIASVTGSMTDFQLNACIPNQAVPTMQIHGTTDLVVPYEGNSMMGVVAIEDVVSYWVSVNQCETDPIITDVPDINMFDLCQAEHYVYENGVNGNSVEFYKIINGGHTWPGALVPLPGNNTNQDFNASEKIWDFFEKYDINGAIDDNLGLLEISTHKKTIIKKIDFLGRTITNSNLYIDVFNDGSVIKNFKLE